MTYSTDKETETQSGKVSYEGSHSTSRVGLAGKPALADATASAFSPSHWDCRLGEKPGTHWDVPSSGPATGPSPSLTALKWKGHQPGS